MPKKKSRSARATKGRTSSGRIRKGYKLTPGGRVVKATRSTRRRRKR
ncbi:MAG: hypothetical protein SangKO_031810 [Sandaracinaceae bacterium]